MFSAAAFITSCPAVKLPVKLTNPTLGLEANLFPTTDPRPWTMFKIPLGKSTSTQISAKISALIGVNWLGFNTIVFPVSKAGAAFLAIKKNGKFQGKIPVVTPWGRLNRKMCSSFLSLWIISPSYLLAHSAI